MQVKKTTRRKLRGSFCVSILFGIFSVLPTQAAAMYPFEDSFRDTAAILGALVSDGTGLLEDTGTAMYTRIANAKEAFDPGLFSTYQPASTFLDSFLCDVWTGLCPKDAAPVIVETEDTPAVPLLPVVETTVPLETEPVTNGTARIVQNVYNTYPTSYVYLPTPASLETGSSRGSVDSNLVTYDSFERQVDAIFDSLGDDEVGLEDLTLESIESLEDVAVMTKSAGDLFSWNGTSWTNVATSTLGLGTSNFSTAEIDTSAELRTILTDETGTGSLVFSAAPTFTGTTTIADVYVSGNVGIGTTTPQEHLHVYGSGTQRLEIESSDTGAAILKVANTNNAYGLLVGDASDKFHIWDYTANASRLVIDSSGNIGIGDSSPAELFTVGNGDLFKVNSDGVIMQDQVEADYDIWIQGGASASEEEVRNLALLGNVTSDDLILNYNTEYDCVSIGGTACTEALDVTGDAAVSGSLYIDGALFRGTTDNNPANNNVQGLYHGSYLSLQMNGGVPLRIGRDGDGGIVQFYSAGNAEGSINISGSTVSYGAFTGSHYALLTGSAEIGELVTLTGDNNTYHGNGESEILYGVEKSSTENDPKILGSYLALIEPEEARSVDNPDQIMAVGNGAMWVADMGEDIETGDYLISSAVPGHARKDPGSYPVSYIIARASEPVEWDDVTETIGGVKHKKITVLFESFTRMNGIAINAEGTVEGFATSTGQLFSFNDTTLWTQLKTLAESFVNGVLTVAGLKAERGEFSEEVCIDGTCITGDELRALLNQELGDIEEDGEQDTQETKQEEKVEEHTYSEGNGAELSGDEETAETEQPLEDEAVVIMEEETATTKTIDTPQEEVPVPLPEGSEEPEGVANEEAEEETPPAEVDVSKAGDADEALEPAPQTSV